MEAALKMIEKLERMARIGRWEMDFASGTLHWSAEVYRIFGVSPEEFAHTHEGFLECVHPEDREMLTQTADRALERKDDSFDIDYRIVRKDNSETRYVHEICEHVYDHTGNLLKYTGLVQDVTGRKELEISLRQGEERYRQLTDDLPVMICEFLPDSTVTYINQAYCVYFEVSKEQIVGRHFLNLLPVQVRGEVKTKYLSLTPDKSLTKFVVCTEHNGKMKWREWRIRAYFDENKNPVRYQGVGIDITERKQTEETLSSINQELLTAKQRAEEAVQSKSAFLASMSHEIRTPLNGLIGMLQLMQMTEPSEEQKELLLVAQTSSDLLLNLINNILDFSKIESGTSQLESQTFDLGALLEEVRIIFMPMMDMKGLVLSLVAEQETPRLLVGDPVRLKQVLINLVANAMKFTREGSISVNVRMIEKESQRARLQWMVQDTGIGIPVEHLDHVFESFIQVPSHDEFQHTGTGLGLTICKVIVEQMEGNIWIKSRESEGSRVYFTTVLGIAEEAEEIRETVPEEKYSDVTPNCHVLVVDDDETSRTFMERVCTQSGCHVTQVENGQKAVDAYLKRHFDVILMDMQMPGTDGTETTRLIRNIGNNHGIHTPMIAVTAKALPGDRENCLAAGLDDYIAKPFTTRQLIDVIERWVGKDHENAG